MHWYDYVSGLILGWGMMFMIAHMIAWIVIIFQERWPVCRIGGTGDCAFCACLISIPFISTGFIFWLMYSSGSFVMTCVFVTGIFVCFYVTECIICTGIGIYGCCCYPRLEESSERILQSEVDVEV